MNNSIRQITAMVFFLLPLVSSGQAVAAPQVETVESLWGTPYDVAFREQEGGVTILGKVRKGGANRSRRLYGRIWIDVIDGEGHVIRRYQGEPHRSGLASHTSRAHFSIDAPLLPTEARLLRISYQ